MAKEYKSVPLTDGNLPAAVIPVGSEEPIPGVIYALRATLAYTDTTAKDLFVLPAGAVIVSEIYNVTALFDSDGTDQVNVGVTGTAAKFASALDVSSTGLKTGVAAEIGAVQGAQQTIKGIYAAGGSAASAGAMTIVWLYYIP